MGRAEPGTLRVQVMWSDGQRQWARHTVNLPEPATAGDALEALARQGVAVPPGGLNLWSRSVGPDAPLRDGDRLAVCRPLAVDPMEARRRRQAVQPLRRKPPARRVSGGG